MATCQGLDWGCDVETPLGMAAFRLAYLACPNLRMRDSAHLKRQAEALAECLDLEALSHREVLP
jgi:hypothetical protein